jgi:hypothetical protein
MKRLAPAALTLLLIACAEETVEPTPAGPDPCALADAEACRVDQKSCSLDDAGAPTCAACGVGMYVSEQGVCTPLEGEALTHEFAEFTTQPGEEVLGLCQSWTLGNETELWINAVELDAGRVSPPLQLDLRPRRQVHGGRRRVALRRSRVSISSRGARGRRHLRAVDAGHPRGAEVPEHRRRPHPPDSRIIGDVHLSQHRRRAITGRHEPLALCPPQAEQ